MIVQISRGVEVTWAKLTATKNCHKRKQNKNFALGSIYSKPKSEKKTVTLDHIAETYNFLNTKSENGLLWISVGDTNDLNFSSIMNLSPTLRSVVTKPTRRNPDRILDNIC